MRVARLHRVVARLYEQALQTAGLTQPQMEVLTAASMLDQWLGSAEATSAHSSRVDNRRADEA